MIQHSARSLFPSRFLHFFVSPFLHRKAALLSFILADPALSGQLR
jgi:hypothetical protein